MRPTGWLLAGAAVLAAAGAPLRLTHGAPPQEPEWRVLLFYDMEGASGIDRDAQFDAGQPDFAAGRQSLVGDVNAVIAGLFEGGATAVDVFNTHGALSDTLVSRAQLDPRAGIISRRGPRDAYDPSSGVLTATYAAAVSIAAHDKPRSGGFAPHTIRVGTTPILNGTGLTETDLLALAVGTLGVPMVMASGDDVLGRSLARTIPGIEYVAVKRMEGSRVVLEPEDRVRAELREAAGRAMGRVRGGAARPWRPEGPISAGLLPTYPAWLYPMMGHLPGLRQQGDTVTFVARDYPEAYRGIRLLLNLASSSTEGLVVDEVRRTPAGRQALRAGTDTVMARWAAFERGEWRPPPP